ncbi:MAG: hypothetical protein RR293_00750 [Bacteroidales bacterium]
MMIYRFILKTFLLAILPTVIFLLGYEFMYREIPNSYSIKYDYLEKNADKVKILILGSSHTFFGVNPAYLPEGSFNCANTSQSLYWDGIIYDTYFKGRGNPEYVVIGISYFSLWSNLAKGEEWWRARKYSIYFGLGEFKDWFNKDNYEFKLGDRQVWDYYVNHDDLIMCSDLGFGTSYIDNSGKDIDKTGLLAAERHSLDIDARRSDFNINRGVIDSIVRDCERGGKKVIFLTTPAYITYRDNIQKAEITLTKKFIEKYVSEYSNVVYLDFFDDSRFDKCDFFDGDHLCVSGARKLSVILCDTIGKLYDVK